MTLQQKKAKKFAETLREWDEFKEVVTFLVKDGAITKLEMEKMLEAEAIRLDL